LAAGVSAGVRSVRSAPVTDRPQMSSVVPILYDTVELLVRRCSIRVLARADVGMWQAVARRIGAEQELPRDLTQRIGSGSGKARGVFGRKQAGPVRDHTGPASISR